jgi:hypothetical protein
MTAGSIQRQCSVRYARPLQSRGRRGGREGFATPWSSSPKDLLRAEGETTVTSSRYIGSIRDCIGTIDTFVTLNDLLASTGAWSARVQVGAAPRLASERIKQPKQWVGHCSRQ